ncbi:hypothetical protein [Sorangium sp. So ce363]|uniref:hypothetical protein n=1 Tax=Sorangium sp. So ce363 TaxID=3133304 RepID=UPI003F5E59DB
MDRSVALVDYALRRRFAFLRVDPDPELVADRRQPLPSSPGFGASTPTGGSRGLPVYGSNRWSRFPPDALCPAARAWPGWNGMSGRGTNSAMSAVSWGMPARSGGLGGPPRRRGAGGLGRVATTSERGGAGGRLPSLAGRGCAFAAQGETSLRSVGERGETNAGP